jgi:hypothetical protein
MLKVYRIYRTKFTQFSIEVKGKIIYPTFVNVGLYYDYSTRDKDIQKAMESNNKFKSVYYLVYTEETIDGKADEGESGEKKVDKEEPIKKENTIFIDFVKTKQEAIAYFKTIGISIETSASKKTILEIASKENIEFPNLG